MRGQCTFSNISAAHDVLMAHLMCSLVFRPYIRVGLQGFPLLRFHKALYLLQIPFPCVFAFKGIIRDPFTTLNFR